MEPIRRDMELLSNSMATYAHLKANPESLALVFMMGVCLGLLTALCLLIVGIGCKQHLRPRPFTPSPGQRQRVESGDEDRAAKTSRSRDGPADAGGHVLMNRTLWGHSSEVFESEEELEKARRLEERERILREIWRNGQPDMLETGTGTLGRVHYP